MKKRCFRKLTVYILVLSLFFTLLPVNFYAEDGIVKEAYALEINLPLSERAYDDSILTNSFYQFKGYANQGKMYIKAENLSGLSLYVNNYKIDTSKLKNNEEIIVDISKFTNNNKNFVQITNVKGKNHKLRIRIPYPTLNKKVNKNILDKKIVEALDSIINEEIRNGSTGVQIVVAKDGQVVKNSSYGFINNYYPSGNPIPFENRVAVNEDTIFDLASNTKMYSVNYAIQKLVHEKKLKISDKVSKFFPEFKDEENAKIKGKDKLTIKELLEHQAGFPPDPQYFNDTYDKDDGIKNGKNDLFSQEKEKTMSMIFKTPLIYEPGTKTRYSDVDYMLLGLIIEKVTEKDLDKYLKDEIYKPLNLDKITFTPLEFGFSKNEIAATELNGNSRDGVVDFSNNRKGTIQGTVHDEKAHYSMGGVSGHAGLFSNALQLAKLAQVMLNEGGYGKIKLWDKTTHDLFIKPKDINPTYGLGWRRTGDRYYRWAFSPLSSPETIGHTGWTGTLSIIDPKEQLIIVLLTNKKNSPVIDNKKNPNNFYADRFLVNRYGLVSSMIYRSLYPSTNEQVLEILDELVTDKSEMIRLEEKYQNKADKADLKSLQNVRNRFVNKIK